MSKYLTISGFAHPKPEQADNMDAEDTKHMTYQPHVFSTPIL